VTRTVLVRGHVVTIRARIAALSGPNARLLSLVCAAIDWHLAVGDDDSCAVLRALTNRVLDERIDTDLAFAVLRIASAAEDCTRIAMLQRSITASLEWAGDHIDRHDLRTRAA
jgi:hypothetical protein